MKREELKELGLNDDQIAAVMTSYGKEVNPLKEQVDSLTSERDNLKQQVSDRDGQLDDLRKNAGKNEELEATIKQLQEDNKAAAAKYQNDLAAKEKGFKIEGALRDAKAKNVKAVLSLIDTEKVSVQKDGTLDGLTDQIEAVKKSDSYLFDAKNAGQPIKFGGNFGNGNNNNGAGKDDIASRIAARFAGTAE
ncbi:phage scaffolding protein [Limosilactobacillus ingluviei]|uniref:Phage minor structural protein GP20 n=1 Tax=Limosilactobacillus ingluviei DSM 15946 TaxID=1423760 RepID=A0A0R1U439_9LACO|nr:phage scaffolding protein [Limosilactobacillus ingluviei]KRL87806.1 phage minor structural protein GP20 [Limosilactobacillus ingluviei DSM 15946]